MEARRLDVLIITINELAYILFKELLDCILSNIFHKLNQGDIMTIYNSTNNISEDYTFIIDINEILYTQEELNTLNLDIYQYSSSQDNITWNTVNSSDIDDIYAILGGDLADLSNPNILDITADFSEILEESQEYNGTVLIYCGIQDDNRNGFLILMTINISYCLFIVILNLITAFQLNLIY